MIVQVTYSDADGNVRRTIVRGDFFNVPGQTYQAQPPTAEQRAQLAGSAQWTDDSTAALAELSQAIAGEILTMPELSDPEWDTYALVAEVSDDVGRR